MEPECIGDTKSQYPPDQPMCSWKNCSEVPCRKPWHKPCSFTNLDLVPRLRPLVIIIGLLDTVVGVALSIWIVIYAANYDRVYDTEGSKIISLSSLGGAITLAVSGMMLLISVILDKQRTIWFYVLTSTFLCLYIFVLSIMKIHYALLALEKDNYDLVKANNQFLLSTACLVGILTLLGSVIHFLGTIAVFTFYNLNYIHPVMFNTRPL